MGLHLVHESRGKVRGQGAIPLVLEVKSQGQLEIKLDCPTLMGSTQGIADVHINLEKAEGRTREKPEPVCSTARLPPLSTYIPGCMEKTYHPRHPAPCHSLETLAVALSI